MTNDRIQICHTCGKKREPLETPRPGFRMNIVRQNRLPHVPGAFVETHSGYMLDARIVRNGGPEDHICVECVKDGAAQLIVALAERVGLSLSEIA